MPRLKQDPVQRRADLPRLRDSVQFSVRKHHCRLCGRVFCSQCSGQQNTIPTCWPRRSLLAGQHHVVGRSGRSATSGFASRATAGPSRSTRWSPDDVAPCSSPNRRTSTWWTGANCAGKSTVKSTVDQLMGLLRDARQRGIPNASSTTIEDRLVRMHETMLAAHPAGS